MWLSEIMKFMIVGENDYARNVTMRGNHLYVSNDKYNRQINARGRAVGIQFSQEGGTDWPQYKWDIIPENFKVYNNIIAGTRVGFYYYYWSSNNIENQSYRNVLVAHNVIKDTKDEAILFSDVPTDKPTPTGNICKNNIVMNSGTYKTIDFGDDELNSWTFSHNNWVRAMPMEGDHKNSFTDDPLFAGKDNSNKQSFKLKSGSPCIDAGSSLAAVNTDFWGFIRENKLLIFIS